MSNNIPKKLAIKAELLRYMETAMSLHQKGHSSSDVKVLTLGFELRAVDRGDEPRLPLGAWRKWLELDK